MELKNIEREKEEKTLGIRMSLKKAQISITSLENALAAKVYFKIFYFLKNI